MLVSVFRARLAKSLGRPLTASLVLGLALALAPVAPATADGPSSIAGAGAGGWTTPPPAETRTAYNSGTIVAPRPPLPRSRTYVTTSPVPATGAYARDVPPPPPPPVMPRGDRIGLDNYTYQAPGAATAAAPTFVGPSTTAPDAGALCAPVAPIVQQPLTVCRLPCEDGISRWHVRGLIGFVTFVGDDSGKDCGYLGADIGRTFCGCWGLDLFYRWNSGQFDRNGINGPEKDGGDWHHLGVKLTYESRIGNSRFYWWAGAGPEYFTTEGYIDDDSGFGIYGEVGVGYLLTTNLRLRAGLGIHGLSTEVTRENPADDTDHRWLWIFGPHIGVEFDF